MLAFSRKDARPWLKILLLLTGSASVDCATDTSRNTGIHGFSAFSLLMDAHGQEDQASDKSPSHTNHIRVVGFQTVLSDNNKTVLQEWQRQPTLAEAAGLRSQLGPETEPAAAPWAAVQQSTREATV